ncbi:hypothetical protein [Mesorhizobium sp. B2-3-6]|uniref:hypothetical protein n=1 Tax=Mesorhizobium sp. B2-3-6 TaxID=2589957 RepID=UPI00112BFECD|nr:hypothetical protein [Mesorhizobium sp. B2-3-6]TPM19766.1 hypothetical protein FJ953_15305 [Mesorhizobium sp. B2-3-6]
MPELMNTIMADGPSSNPSQPVKALLRAWGTWVEGIITAFLSNGGLIYDTKAHMDADLAHGANSSAWVVSDATVANNGIYRKLGASGAGSWTRVADLPYSFIKAIDAGAGAPNAIVATSTIPLPSADGGTLVNFIVFEANTASPVTVAFNGGTALTIKTASGNDVAPGGLTAGMMIAGFKSGATFRLLSDQASAAIQAAAEAAANAAAASASASATSAASAAASAASASGAVPVANRTAAKALDPSTKKAFIIYDEGGRNGPFVYTLTSSLSTMEAAAAAADTLEGVFFTNGLYTAVRQADWHESGLDARWCGLKADSNGTTGNGTDNQPAFQAAVNLAVALDIPKLNLPNGIVRCGSVVTISEKSLTLNGAGMGLPDAWPDPIIPSMSPGTWLYFDHTGIGIQHTKTSTNPRFASRVQNLTTMRNQPAPGPGWAPTSSGADFDIWAHMVHFDNVGLLNPYIAFSMVGAPCSFNHVRGQPLYRFVQVFETFDVCRWNDIHLWPYWSLDADVGAFMNNNLIAFNMARCDNPQMSNIFSIRQNIGIRLYQGTTGSTTRLKGTNIEFDNGGSGLVIASGTTGLIVQLTHFIVYCSTSIAADTRGIIIEGTGHNVHINGLDVSNSGAQAVLLQGTSNKLGIENYRLANYGENTATVGGLTVSGTGNRLTLTGAEDVSSPQVGSTKYSDLGTGNAIVVDDWRAYTPTITATTGTITTVSSVVGRFRRNLKSIDWYAEFVVTTNGTGAGMLRVTTPEAATASAGAEGTQSNSGFNLNGSIASGNAYADFRKYDGTYPGVSATVVRVWGNYPVA